MTEMADPRDFAALSFLPFNCRIDIAERLRRGDDPGDILRALAARPSRASAGTVRDVRARAAAALGRAARHGIRVVTWSDPAYPALLAAVIDPPPVLWIRGTAPRFEAPAVAIVGSRAGSPYALAVAERLASELAGRGVVVVSGLARGVDSAAHRGALAGTGTTVAVLGSGADIVYPREHLDLASDIAQRGALVSELAPGTRPLPFFFPMRNRIISGLSRAVVVIEAGEKSGSLITARCALDQGRDVLAVPGNVLSGRNRGGHALLRDGAKIVESADDILEELGLPVPTGRSSGVGEDAPKDAVLGSFTVGETCDLDAIAKRSGLPIVDLLPRLCELELQGLIRRAGGGRFVRFDSSC
jgi:DNA processing protein